jgi:hypothetical protein
MKTHQGSRFESKIRAGSGHQHRCQGNLFRKKSSVFSSKRVSKNFRSKKNPEKKGKQKEGSRDKADWP